eukprot:Awhi_evm1s4095
MSLQNLHTIVANGTSPIGNYSIPAVMAAPNCVNFDFGFYDAGIPALYSCDNDSNYEYFRLPFNSRAASGNYPSVNVFPQNSEGVTFAVNASRQANMRVCPRSGGHSYNGYSSCNQGMLIDLRQLNSAYLVEPYFKTSKRERNDNHDNQNSENHLQVKVESGFLLGALYNFLVPLGHTLPMGSCPTVGVGGHASGGGFGMIARKYGLLSDRLVETKIVLANGDLKTISKNKNSDLFFAVRGGGGGNFGIVTEFTFDVVPKPKNNCVVSQSWDVVKYGKIVLSAYLALISQELDDDYIVRVAIVNDNIELGGQIIGHSATNCSTVQQQINEYFEHIPDAQVPWNSTVTSLTYEETLPYQMGLPTNTTLDEFSERPDVSTTEFGYYSSTVLQGMTEAFVNSVIDKYIENMATNTNGAVRFIQFDPLGGKMTDLQVKATAFPYRRKEQHLVQIFSEYTSGDFDSVETGYVESVKASMGDFSVGNYVNYIDAQDYISTYYGRNFKKLQN